MGQNSPKIDNMGYSSILTLHVMCYSAVLSSLFA